MLTITPDNTLFFGDDFEELFYLLEYIDEEVKARKSLYYYHHLIWADKNGWYLTVQIYDKRTSNPINANL